MSPVQVMRLGLRGAALAAADEFARQHPDAVFSSGKRTREEQACAMAKNIIKGGRFWIEKTYRDSIVSRTLQQWIDKHPEVKTKKVLAALLLAGMAIFTDDELATLSLHFTGDAFDVAPPEAHLAATLQLQTLRGVVRKFGGKLITEEGGVTVWHAQFKKKS